MIGSVRKRSKGCGSFVNVVTVSACDESLLWEGNHRQVNKWCQLLMALSLALLLFTYSRCKGNAVIEKSEGCGACDV